MKTYVCRNGIQISEQLFAASVRAEKRRKKKKKECYENVFCFSTENRSVKETVLNSAAALQNYRNSAGRVNIKASNIKLVDRILYKIIILTEKKVVYALF